MSRATVFVRLSPAYVRNYGEVFSAKKQGGRALILKKINAALALLSAAVLLTHNALNSRMMLLMRVDDSPKLLARLLFIFVVLHAAISILILIFRHDGGNTRYVKLGSGWLLQRVTGIALLPFAAFHAFIRVGDYGFGLIPILIAHTFILLFAFAHISVSVPNALVTLGWIDTERGRKRVQTVCTAVCVLSAALALTASISEVIAL